MSEESRSCSSCGARVSATADQCPLCGTPAESPTGSVGESDRASEEGSVPRDREEGGGESPETRENDADVDRVYCHECGHANPGAANYCSRCGTKLDDVSVGESSEEGRPVRADLPTGTSSRSSSDERSPSSDTAPDTQTTQEAVGKRVALTVGLGILLVVGFFFVTQWSQERNWGSESESQTAAAGSEADAGPAGAGGATGSTARSGMDSSSATGSSQPAELRTLVEKFGNEVDGPVGSKIDSLRQQLEDGDGSNTREVRSALVRLYIGAGAPGRAALIQSRIAEETGGIDDQRRAANLLYKWMRQVEQQNDRAAIANAARHVATAYEEVVREAPTNLDARTRMGEAYLLTNNPMKGIQAINAVLEDDSTFVPARFQKGLALLQINRLDQAIRQFEQVKTHADPGDPFYKQAERAITVINEETSTPDGGSPSSTG